MAGRAALSITTKSHKDRRSKSVSGQEIPPHRLKDDRLPLLVITNNQEYSPLSSAAMSATCSKTWDGGPHGSHEDCKAALMEPLTLLHEYCKAEASPPQTEASGDR